MSHEEVESLYKEYYYHMYSYAKKKISTAFIHDTIVDVFVVLYKDQRSIIDYPHIGNYLFKCLQNRCIDMLRATRYHDHWNTRYWEDDEAFEDIVEPYELIVEKDELAIKKQNIANTIKSLIPTLPERMRQVVEMSIIDGIAHKDICIILGIAPRTLLNTKHRAIKILKTKLLNK